MTGDGPASFQGFLSPDLEWGAWRSESWRAGPLARGYFTVNEGPFSSLNLASYQPGAFFERTAAWGETPIVSRLEYVYTLDLLGENRFGERHALTASWMFLPLDGATTYTYITASQSDYADDGANPTVTSLDGPAISAGFSRFYQTALPAMPTWSWGVDLQSAMTDGDDYRYLGAAIHGDCTLRLSDRWTFIPSANLGYRDYSDFTGTPSRNELTSRLSGKLRWQCNDFWSVSLVVSYDRFSSPNPDFDADRIEAGMLATLLY